MAQALRWMVGGLVLVSLLAGCSSPDQKLQDAAAQAAREARSEVATVRLTVEQLQAHRLWSQPAEQLVADAEKGLGKTASAFSAQQPTTDESRRIYAQTTKALDDAQTAVTATRIALGNGDLAAASREIAVLQKSATALGELAR